MSAALAWWVVALCVVCGAWLGIALVAHVRLSRAYRRDQEPPLLPRSAWEAWDGRQRRRIRRGFVLAGITLAAFLVMGVVTVALWRVP